MEHGSSSKLSRRRREHVVSAPRQRADRLLVERGLFESRAKAQAAIEAGLVFADDRPVSKASEELASDSVIASAAYPHVSRGINLWLH
jgi:23S rRNA (cytidine1920-2'-O)/16S rRNA (cytidine1409-2'-O)-methyltransferase